MLAPADLPGLINVDGVLRPTRNIRDQLIHPTEEGIANFWRWFGDSQATSHGAPLPLYHGTSGDFDAFETPEMPGTFGVGIYAGDSRSAGSWAQDEGCLVVPVYLRLCNPYRVAVDQALMDEVDIDAPGVSLVHALFQNPMRDRLVERYRDSAMLDGDVTAELIRRGHDGVIATYEDGSQEWVVFQPAQLKSALGNSGAFDPDSSSLTDRGQGPLAEAVMASTPYSLEQRLALLAEAEDALRACAQMRPPRKGPELLSVRPVSSPDGDAMALCWGDDPRPLTLLDAKLAEIVTESGLRRAVRATLDGARAALLTERARQAEHVHAVMDAILQARVVLPDGHSLVSNFRFDRSHFTSMGSRDFSWRIRCDRADDHDHLQIHGEQRVFLDKPRACQSVAAGRNYYNQNIDLMKPGASVPTTAGWGDFPAATTYAELAQAMAENINKALADFKPTLGLAANGLWTDERGMNLARIELVYPHDVRLPTSLALPMGAPLDDPLRMEMRDRGAHMHLENINAAIARRGIRALCELPDGAVSVAGVDGPVFERVPTACQPTLAHQRLLVEIATNTPAFVDGDLSPADEVSRILDVLGSSLAAARTDRPCVPGDGALLDANGQVVGKAVLLDADDPAQERLSAPLAAGVRLLVNVDQRGHFSMTKAVLAAATAVREQDSARLRDDLSGGVRGQLVWSDAPARHLQADRAPAPAEAAGECSR